MAKRRKIAAPSAEDLDKIEEAFRRNQIPPQEMKAEVHEIVMQILKSTIDAHHRSGSKEEVKSYIDLYKNLLEELKDRGLSTGF